MMQQDANIREQTRLSYGAGDYYLTVTLRRSGRINVDVIPRVAEPEPCIDEAQAGAYRTIVELLRAYNSSQPGEVHEDG